MTNMRRWVEAGVVLALAGVLSLVLAGASCGQEKKRKNEWTSPDDPTLPIDYRLQGEYVGPKIGAQVIALGQGHFQVVVLPGGLPGAGWDGKQKSLLDGKLDGETVKLAPTTGKRRYKAQKPSEFSATSKFPPTGQKAMEGTLSEGKLALMSEEGTALELRKIVRKSPTMGAKPPAGAVVLFDGTSAEKWNGARVDPKTKLLNTDRHDIRTKEKYTNYTVHAEFLVPYLPEARDQGRGNSGFYQVDQYEVQILDSFGLDGKNNECGGLYSKRDSDVNACFPPLTWQTYDIDFTAAKRDPETGKKIKNARITVKLNGIVVHDNVEITGPSGGARNEPEGTPGALQFQGHGNILQFRNVWIVPK
ncbi:MAG: DUF1080 domain-containing protein [Gemmataceae bacterium]